jgi:hypothetical protein
MPVETRFIEAHSCVCQSYIGPCGVEDYLTGTRTTLELFARHANARCLVDLRLLDNTARLTDLYQLPDSYPAMNMPTDVKIALLAVPNHKDQDAIRFYETICVNRGWRVMTTFDREEGLHWLGE